MWDKSSAVMAVFYVVVGAIASNSVEAQGGALPDFPEGIIESTVAGLVQGGLAPAEATNLEIRVNYNKNKAREIPAITAVWSPGAVDPKGNPLPTDHTSQTGIYAASLAHNVPSTYTDEGWNQAALSAVLKWVIWHELHHAHPSEGGVDCPGEESEGVETCEHLGLSQKTASNACQEVAQYCQADPPTEEDKAKAKALCELIKHLQNEFNDNRQKAEDCAAGGVSGYPSQGMDSDLQLTPPPTPPQGEPPAPYPIADCDHCDCFSETEQEEVEEH